MGIIQKDLMSYYFPIVVWLLLITLGGFIGYIFYLVIKALKIYIKNNI